jgi:hypothetical protein
MDHFEKHFFIKFKFKCVYRSWSKSNRKYLDCRAIDVRFLYNENIFFLSQGGMDAHTA